MGGRSFLVRQVKYCLPEIPGSTRSFNGATFDRRSEDLQEWPAPVSAGKKPALSHREYDGVHEVGRMYPLGSDRQTICDTGLTDHSIRNPISCRESQFGGHVVERLEKRHDDW